MVHRVVFLKLSPLCRCIRQPNLEVDGPFLQDDALHLLLIVNVETIGLLPPATGLCGFSP